MMIQIIKLILILHKDASKYKMQFLNKNVIY